MEKPIFEKRDYPVNSLLIGNDSNKNTFKIFIEKDILSGIDSYLSAETDKESGGILIGNVFMDDNEKLFIIIDNFIIARNTKSGLTKLTFTPETWENINLEKEKYHNDKIILGWFHSHPGHKVFLSSYDIFIQENFFNDSYNIAYVFDPINNERGFFVWVDGKIVKSDNYFLLNNGPFDIENSKTNDSKMKNDLNSSDKLQTKTKFWIIIFLLAVNIFITLLLVIDNSNSKKDMETLKENINSIKTINNNIGKIDLKLNDILLNQISQKDTTNIINKK